MGSWGCEGREWNRERRDCGREEGCGGLVRGKDRLEWITGISTRIAGKKRLKWVLGRRGEQRPS